MEIAATIKLPQSVPSRLSLAAVRPFRSPSSPSFIHQRLLRPNTTAPMKLSTRLSAANETMANPISPTDGFLGRTSEGFVPFCKFQGLGNDFIMIDNRKSPELRISRERAVQLCDRNFGIGADGVIFALPPDYTSEYGMRIYNSDGSEPEMCGNGIRCLAKFLAQLESLERNQSYKIRTGAGIIITELQPDGRVRVNMGQPILEASAIPTSLPPNKDDSVVKAELEVDGVTWNVTCVSMGNPHCVTFGTKGGEGLQVDELNLAEIGPKFEIHDAFPARTNTEFVQVLSRTHLKMRVWERGAGATLACGTGACAVVVAAVLEGIAERSCTVDLPGGPLMIEWNETNNRVYMTGPAEPVFFGQFPLEI